MKLAAIVQRGSRKDFLDIYAIAVRRIPLDKMLELYGRKYSIQDISHVLYGLAYFDIADKERSPRLLWDLRWRDVKRSIQGWLTDLSG